MKKIFLIVVLICFSNFEIFAQQALWDVEDIISPEIHKDNTVTFRLKAPKAIKVKIIGDFLPDTSNIAELKESKDGVWEYTTPQSLKSELYNYFFIVDGLKITDPNNVYLARDISSVTNVFIIGNGRGDLYKVNNVSHGAVTHRWYNSTTLGKERRLTIYTPPSYESSRKSYPVLYLLHGMGGDEEAWITLGRSTQILDNLIAQGKAIPMIVVMTNGNIDQEAAPGESSLGLYKPSIQLPRTMEGSMEESFPDVINFIDSNYRTIKKKSGRSIAGLSMGGFHSLHISKQYPDMFDYVGLFSAAIMPKEDIISPVYDNMDGKLEIQFKKNPKLYWIAIGKTDFLFKANEDYRKLLDEKGYKYIYFENEDGHIWRNWRLYLAEFATMLFK